MTRTRCRLTALKVASIKKPGLYADGGSLYLRVAPGGSKGWIFRFTVAGRTRDAGLGSYPTISLAKARQSADEFRRQVAADVDPIEARNAQRLAVARAPSFEECAKFYMASHEVAWKNDKHRAQWRSTLATYAFPVIGALPVPAIDTQLVLKILEPIWATKPETASRLRGRIEVILSWAKVRGYRDGENPAQWRGHLDHLLPAKGKVRKVVHHAALPYSEISAFLNLLRRQSCPSARALEFLILTASRTSEALSACWSEIDRECQLWSIPAERMKAGKEHRVPLTPRARAILHEMHQIRQSDFVFPGMKPGQPLSQMALAMLLRRIGSGHVTVHGFRSTFRDWAAECTLFSGELAEMALAHAVSNAVEAAYRRGDMLDKRRKMMEAWSAFCGGESGVMLSLRTKARS